MQARPHMTARAQAIQEQRFDEVVTYLYVAHRGRGCMAAKWQRFQLVANNAVYRVQNELWPGCR